MRERRDEPMEHRTELEQILLAGLPERERHETVQSIRAATAKKLDYLQRQERPSESDSRDFA
jgi:hypothetical protein